jgi:subtilisin family serine protease
MNSALGWDYTTGTADVIIAVLDTGIDETHPDLSGKITAGYDFIDGDSDPHDLNGHGTHVAGIAAAATDNGIGMAGTSWGARIMPVRVLNASGGGTSVEMIDGINWAVSNGADIINLSLGGAGDSASAQQAINNAHASGVLVVAAMGNCRYADDYSCDEANPTNYPAAYENVMAVSATGPDDTWASYSQYGSHCDIAAPGGDMSYLHDSDGIYSTMPTYDVHLTSQYGYAKNYDYLNGTSQATPYVAGLAALVLSADPTLTPDDVQTFIENNADDLGSTGWDADYGHGRIDVGATLQALDIPGVPTLSTIVNGDKDGDYVVTWSSDPEATTYTLEEDDNADFTSPQSINVGSDTQYTVTQQAAGIWYYRVQASNANGSSAWSNVESTSVLPVAPVLSSITGSDDAYAVSWSAVAGATGYALHEAPTSAFSPTATITRYVGGSTQYDVTGQRSGTWYYRVRAIASTGNSDWSNVESTTVPTTTLGVPVMDNIDNADEDGDYLITWTSVPSATTYTLEESSDRYFANTSELYSGGQTQFAIEGRSPGYWHYRVRAHSSTESSAWSLPKIAHVGHIKVHLPLVMRSYTPPGTLQNGDFEEGKTGWTEYSSNGFDIIMSAGLPDTLTPHSGQWAAWLGGASDDTSYIEQTVTVSGQAPYLTYWHWLASEDICGYDYGYILANGQIVDQYELCENNNTSGWAPYSVDLSAYAGQMITVRIQVVTDSSLNSVLFVDDVAFNSSVLASTPATHTRREMFLPFKALAD